VAYRQPVTAGEVAAIRGRSSTALLAQLVRRELILVERIAGPPRKTVYRTTAKFLALFGLRSLDDLPRSQDLDRS
jgi:segregation and condensation protein B